MVSSITPFEFIVVGRPVSLQTKQKKRLSEWKSTVRRAAAQNWSQAEPLDHFLKIMLTYYFDVPLQQENTVPDSDNVIKPVREALKGLIYAEDSQVADFVSRRRNLNRSFRIRGISQALAEGFCQGKEFVHIRVEDAPDPSDLS